MAEAYQLPVFLPGGTDDWSHITATASVEEDGSLDIRFDDNRMLQGLIDVLQAGILVKLVFDYKLTEEQLQQLVQ